MKVDMAEKCKIGMIEKKHYPLESSEQNFQVYIISIYLLGWFLSPILRNVKGCRHT